MRRLRLGLALSVLAVQGALARAYTVDDLLSTEALGLTLFDPTGRTLVIEHQRPWRTAERFDLNAATPLRLTELLKVDLARPGPARPLLRQSPRAGYFAGPIAPDGAHMLVYRLQGHELSAGIARLTDGQTRWLRLAPDLPVYGRAAQWRDAGHLILLTRAPDETPRRLALGWLATHRLAEAAAITAAGQAPSRSRFGSGRYLNLRLRRAPSALVEVEATTGRTRALAEGEWVDLELSPDGTQAALLENAEEIQPTADSPVFVATPSRRRRIVLVDLATGARRRPCPEADIAKAPLAWSPASDRLLVARRTPGPAQSLQPLLVTVPSGACRVLDTPSLQPAATRNGEGDLSLPATWWNNAPLLRATPTGGGRADWYGWADGQWNNLTAGLPAQPDGLAAVGTNRLLVAARPGLWRLAPHVGPSLAAPNARVAPSPEPGGSRIAALPPGTDPSALIDGARTSLIWSADNPRLALDPDTEVLAAAPLGAALLVRLPDGRRRLDLVTPAGGRWRVLALNPGLAAVSPARIEPVRQGDGRTGWLYLPAQAPAGARLPLVVIPYPGHVFDRPPEDLAPGEWNDWANAQLLAAAGYAVLAPSLPAQPATDPRAMTAALLQALDAALARGDLDPDRVALLGQSYGAHAALAAATQSSRFRSIVASAGIYDQAMLWGGFPLHQWLIPQDGYAPNLTAGLVEQGQAGLGAPPWAAADRYLAASPLFAADRVTAPVLLIAGQADEIGAAQSQALFTALYRQAKDAQLVTYWGEGHTLASPANIRDKWAIILQWLAETLGPAPSPTRSAARPPPSGRS